MKYEFTNNMPIPESNFRGNTRYPFRLLEINQSVFYPCADDQIKFKARKAAYRIGETKHWKIVVRAVEGGIRVWRTA